MVKGGALDLRRAAPAREPPCTVEGPDGTGFHRLGSIFRAACAELQCRHREMRQEDAFKAGLLEAVGKTDKLARECWSDFGWKV